jgi:pimeloyl-ACP methyl ester carboxylesterase
VSRTVVVYVHGLWLNGWEGVLLRRRLARRLGCETRAFSYASVSAGVSDNARALEVFLGQMSADTLHLVGHSLGGLLIFELFARSPALPPGRVVFLGSPLQGSRAARNLDRLAFGRRMMGFTGRELLVPVGGRRWSGPRELGVIAGSLALGMGRFVGSFDEPNDGTVLVSETQIEGAKRHLTLHTTHTGMVYSPVVAGHVAKFLQEGDFAAIGRSGGR